MDDVDPVDPTAPRLPVVHGGKRNNVREAITRELATHGLIRPYYNKKRNRLT